MTLTPKIQIQMYPLLSTMAAVTDLISPILTAHHHKVAFIAATIGQAMGLSKVDVQQLAMAGAVHDIGGLSLQRRLDSFAFEVDEPWRHTVPGFVLLSSFPPFAELARVVRFHHVKWQNGRGEEDKGEPVPRLSHLVHLADRLAVRINPQQEILRQKEKIIGFLAEGAGDNFVPEQIEALMEVAGKEAFWFDLSSPEIGGILLDRMPLGEITLSKKDLPGLAELFRKIIDFRSRFTATHSSGVASVAAALAEKIGWDRTFIDRMLLAGLLHDIGKLVVPAEILNKHTPLTSEDFAVIRKHPYYSARILRNLDGFEEIGQWAGLHHERLDGSGYPYRPHEEDIPEGARILAVADTFTALTEDRPYRCGMPGANSDQIMQKLALQRKLDNRYMTVIHDHFEEFGHLCLETQKAADTVHRRFMENCLMLDRTLDPDDYCPAKQPATRQE